MAPLSLLIAAISLCPHLLPSIYVTDCPLIFLLDRRKNTHIFSPRRSTFKIYILTSVHPLLSPPPLFFLVRSVASARKREKGIDCVQADNVWPGESSWSYSRRADTATETLHTKHTQWHITKTWPQPRVTTRSNGRETFLREGSDPPSGWACSSPCPLTDSTKSSKVTESRWSSPERSSGQESTSCLFCRLSRTETCSEDPWHTTTEKQRS